MAAISRKVIEQIKEEVRADMILSGEIALDDSSLAKLAGMVAPKLPAPKLQVSRADLQEVREIIQNTIHIPADGQDGRNGADGQDGAHGIDGRDGADLSYTPEIKNDIADGAARLIDTEKIAQKAASLVDPTPIAEKASELVKIPEVRADLSETIIDDIMAAVTERFVAREIFKRRMDDVAELIKKSSKPLSAGISGGDMIAEINKSLGGAGWQSAGGLMNVVAGASFDGTSAPPITIYASANVSSIDDLNVGHWRLNFANPISGAYLPVTGYGHTTAAARSIGFLNPTTTTLEVRVFFGVTPSDITNINVIIFQ